MFFFYRRKVIITLSYLGKEVYNLNVHKKINFLCNNKNIITIFFQLIEIEDC